MRSTLLRVGKSFINDIVLSKLNSDSMTCADCAIWIQPTKGRLAKFWISWESRRSDRGGSPNKQVSSIPVQYTGGQMSTMVLVTMWELNQFSIEQIVSQFLTFIALHSRLSYSLVLNHLQCVFVSLAIHLTLWPYPHYYCTLVFLASS